MNSRVFLASLLLFPFVNHSMEENKHDLTLANFEPLFHREHIKARVTNLGAQISNDYVRYDQLTVIAIMKGALPFVADLMRHIEKVPVIFEFIQTSSYGQNGTNPGALTITGLDQLNLEGKHVLLVDDIFDTGQTLSKVLAQIRAKKNPASLKSAVLLLKNKPRSVKEVPEYAAFKIDDQFVIGYGLDYKEQFRELPDIWVKKD